MNGLSGTGTLTSAANYDLVVWNVGVNGASSTFDGAITRLPAKNSTLNKLGAGTLTLTGTNSTGNTAVSAGTLLVNSPGSLAATNLTVDADATLGGSGTINGSVTVNANGTISAGASAGILTVGNELILGAGATNVWELAANDIVNWGGTQFDQIILTSGSLTLDPTAVLVIKFIGTATTPSLANSFWQYPRQWQVIAGNPGVANFSILEGTNGITAGTFTTTADATAVTLVYTPSVAPPAPTCRDLDEPHLDRQHQRHPELLGRHRGPVRPRHVHRRRRGAQYLDTRRDQCRLQRLLQHPDGCEPAGLLSHHQRIADRLRN